MNTYHELIAKANELMFQAEQARVAEAAEVIKHVRALVSTYRLTPKQVFGKAVNIGQPKDGPKYRGPNGEIWIAGRRGRKPMLVRNLIDSGDDIEKYRVD